MKQVSRLLQWSLDLDRSWKRLVVLAMDAVLCAAAVWLAFSLRLGVWQTITTPLLQVLGVTLVVFPPVFLATGTYRSVVRFAGAWTILQLASAVAMVAVPLIAIFTLYAIPGVPRTVGVLLPILFFGLLAISRMVARYLFVEVLSGYGFTGDISRVLIYGAGNAGQQLAKALRPDRNFILIGFVDDDRRLHRQRLDGISVNHSAGMGDLVRKTGVDTIYLALPGIGRHRRREIVDRLLALDVQVQTLPSVQDMIDGRVSINSLREVHVQDLLGRDAVAPDDALMRRNIAGKTVLVTGAGGSIGSELCRRIALENPQTMVLADMSEPALHLIERELDALCGGDSRTGPALHAELLNTTDADAVQRVFAKHKPDTVFHAAAYKHVPLVEANVVAGVFNNVFGTLNTATAARRHGTASFILISTDKAVRPTNVMGATKRACEMILQALAQQDGNTVFSMVRFGNVLGSSGSVVPLFKKQIEAGGPITLTHRDINRFFMTIPEAAQLVIQAGAMARGGEVFLLDMGKPVKIYDLARTMIKLSGLNVRDAQHPDGDIEILETGLRPGEKLYEELLIDDHSAPTDHVRIMQAREKAPTPAELEPMLERLRQAVSTGSDESALAVLREMVPEYAPVPGAGEAGPGVPDRAVAAP